MTLHSIRYNVTNSPSKIEGAGGEYDKQQYYCCWRSSSSRHIHKPLSITKLRGSSTLNVGSISNPFGTAHRACGTTHAFESPRALRGCMVLLMNSFFEAFDLFEVVYSSFATASTNARNLNDT